MAERGSRGSSGELVQITLLTLLMTGTGLFLFFLVMRFWLVPARASEADEAARRYGELVKLLGSDELRSLRDQAKKQEEAADQGTTLLEIIDQQRSANVVEFERTHSAKALRGGGESRQIDLKPCRLDQIFRFVVGVREARKTIEVDRLTISPSRRREEAESYTASVTFVDFVPAGSQPAEKPSRG